VVLYECETWSLALREENRLRVFENRVFRIFGPKRDDMMGVGEDDGENCIKRNFVICTPCQV
jgi:hypothetical protein